MRGRFLKDAQGPDVSHHFAAERLEARWLLAATFASGGDHDMAVDAAGNTHLAFYDAAAKSIKYTEQTAAGAWLAPVTVAPLAADAGGQISLALTPGGAPIVAYYDSATGHLKYTYASRGTWRATTVDPLVAGGIDPSLAIRPDGTPVITYYSDGARQLRAASASTAGTWSVVAVSGRSAAAVSRVVIDPTTGVPLIVFQARTGQLYSVQLTARGLTAAVKLDASRAAASNLSVTYGPDNLLAVAFYDPAIGRVSLLRARPRGRFAVTSIIDGLSADPSATLIFNPATGLPQASYYVGDTSSLFLASMADATAPFSSQLLMADASGAGKVVSRPGTSAAILYSGIETRDGTSFVSIEDSAVSPLPPTGLTSAPVSSSEIDLAWSNTSSSQSAIGIERSSDGVNFGTIATLTGTATSYADTGLRALTPYYYRVTAIGSDGSIAPACAAVPVPGSQTLTTATTLAGNAPAAPANVVATAVSDTEVNLTWDRTGAGETSITVWRSDSGGPWKVISTQPAGSNIWTDTSCYPGRTYSYYLTADNAVGSSAASHTGSATTQPSGATRPAATTVVAKATSPFDVTLTWFDGVSVGHSWLIERSADGTAYTLIATVAGSGTTATYTDTLLSPGTTYFYRLRADGYDASYSDYTPAIPVTTAARPVNTPLEATNLAAVVHSATATTLTWSDTNGGTASYLIEIAPFSWSGTPAWTQVAQTAPGATSYELTTTAETFYYVRVRAQNAAGTSGSTPQVIVRSASPGTGSPKTYTIGPGQQYASLAALDWTKLGPGDTVMIYPNKDGNGNVIPYYEKPLISVRGTDAAPIKIAGVPDAVTGQLPIIDGFHATTAAQWQVGYMPFEDLSLVLIGPRAGQGTTGWSPGYFTFSNLEVRNAYAGDPSAPATTYTASDGSTRTYGSEAGGIYIEDGDHITIKGCVIHGNENGVFGAGQGDQRNLEDVTLDSNHIYGNGTVNGFLTHNTYLEGIDTLYQFNTYGPLRSGSYGLGLKDRGAGTVIRYNFIQGGGHLIDLVEAQNYSAATFTLPSYRQTYVYGNVLLNDVGAVNGAAQTPIHYGGDQFNPFGERKGVLHFYNNTLVDVADLPQQWAVTIFATSDPGEAVDARNNVIAFLPKTAGQPVPELDVLPGNGIGYLGANWFSIDWRPASSAYPFTGHLDGAANVLTDPQNAVGFLDAANGDYRLAPSSAAVDAATALSADCPPVLFQYVTGGGWQPRSITGLAPDLGAIESSSQ